MIDRAKQWFDETNNSLDFSAQLESFGEAADKISQQVINMIVVFVLQTLLLPLMFLWLIIKLFKLAMAQISLSQV